MSRNVGDGLTDGLGRGRAPARTKGTEAGEEYGGRFAQSLRKRLDAALRSLPKVEINADSTDADVKLAAIRAELEALRDARIGVDVDEAVALAQIDRLKVELDRLRVEHPSIAIDIDAAAATAELAAIQAEVAALAAEEPTIDVDVDDHGSIVAATSGIGALLAAGIALAPALIPVAAAIAAAFAGIGLAISAGLAGAAVTVLGLHGVAGAVKALGDAQSSAGKDAAQYAAREAAVAGASAGLANAEASAADTRVRAAEQVANAQRQLGVAEREAAISVRDAERAVADAQRQATLAQQALTAARKEARRQLEDLALQVADGALAQRQASLDLRRAKAELDATLADPQATELQRQQAQLSYDQAKQQTVDLGVQQRRLRAQKAAADKAGVAGSQVVQSAEQQVLATRERVVREQQRLAQTQVQATERVAAAQRAVVDAVRAQASAERQAAFSIAQAQRGVESARRGMAETATSAVKLREAMDGLSPAGRRFAVFLAGTLIPRLRGLRDSAAEGLLPGLQAGMTALLPVLPTLGRSVGIVARAMGDLFASAGRALASPFWQRFLQFAANAAARSLPLLARTLGGLARGFAGLAEAFFPLALRFGQFIAGLADRFGQFGQQVGQTSGFHQFIAYTIASLPAVGALLRDLAVVVIKLVIAFAPLGLVMLKVVDAVLAFLAALSPGQLIAVLAAAGIAVLALGIAVESVTLPLTLIVVSIVAVAAALVYAWTHFATFRRVVTEVGRDVAAATLWLWEKVLHPTYIAVAAAVMWLWQHVFRPAWTGIQVAVQVAWAIIEVIFGLLRIQFKVVGTAVAQVWNHILRPVFSALGTVIHDFVLPPFAAGVKAIGNAWNSIIDLVKKPVKFVVDVILNKGILAAYNWLAKKFHITPDNVHIDLPAAFDSPPPSGGGGGPATGRGRAFAGGGPVDGPGTSTSDSVVARLSTGEHVWTAAEVSNAGGHAAVLALRTAARTGDLPQFRDGGIVGAAKAAARKAVSAGKTVAGTAADLAEAVAHPVKFITDRITAALSKLTNNAIFDNPFGRVVAAVPKQIAAGVIDKVKSFVGLGGASDSTQFAAQVGKLPLSASVADVAARTVQLLSRPVAEVPGWARRIMFESGGNWSAVNRWDCLTIDAMILTKRGWLKHDEVQVGDETIGYNPATRRSEWTRVTKVHHYSDAPLVRLRNSRWQATTTPNHRWVEIPRVESMQSQQPADCPECGWTPVAQLQPQTGMGVHRAKTHGVRGGASTRNRVDRPMRFTTTADIGVNSRLLLAAPAETESGIDITTEEAALLGWIAGDGYVERACPTPAACGDAGYTPTGVCREHGARQNPSMSVGQSKPLMVEKLKLLLATVPHAVYVDDPPTRTGKKAVGPRHVFRIGYQYAQDLLRRAGHPKDAAVAQVLKMSAEQRAAWLEAMIDAEGHRAEKAGYSEPQVTIYQCGGAVLEAISLAVYLSGRRPRVSPQKEQNSQWRPVFCVRVNNPFIRGQYLDKEDAGRGEVWCVTTELGTWTARQDDHIFLTGNSNWAAGTPSVGGAQLIAGTFARYAGPFRSTGPFLYGVSIDPLANSYAGGNYAVDRYGSLAAVDPLVRPEGYDAGGLLTPGWNLAYNGLGQPEPVLSPQQWDVITRGGGRTYNVAVDNHGRDLDGWDVVRAIRQQEALIPDLV